MTDQLLDFGVNYPGNVKAIVEGTLHNGEKWIFFVDEFLDCVIDLKKADAARLARILARWAETGELEEDDR